MPRGRPRIISFTPLAGVRSDFNKALKMFADTKSVRYEQFAEIWRELKLSFIFTGRDSEKELREFTEDMFNVVVELWMPPSSFQNRVGALYLLYGLYFKQLSEPKVKIRITFTMWENIVSFMEEVKRQQHLDVEYCFHKLCYYRAFYYTATVSERILSHRQETTEGKKSKEELEKTKTVALAEQKSILSEILEPDSIDQLSAIHEQYHHMKCALTGQAVSVPDSSLNIIEANLVQVITKSVATYEEWRKKKASGQKVGRRRRDSGATSGTTSDSEGESYSEGEMYIPTKKTSHGQRRAEIRARAFAGSGTSTRGRRHRQAGKTREESSGSSSPRKRIKSRKSAKTCESSQDSSFETNAFEKTELAIKKEEDLGIVLDMPLLEIVEPTMPVKKRGRPKKSPSAGKKSKKGPETSSLSPSKTPTRISLKQSGKKTPGSGKRGRQPKQKAE